MIAPLFVNVNSSSFSSIAITYLLLNTEFLFDANLTAFEFYVNYGNSIQISVNNLFFNLIVNSMYSEFLKKSRYSSLIRQFVDQRAHVQNVFFIAHHKMHQKKSFH